MAVNIVTGMTGVAHITSDDDRCFNASILGKGKYVFEYGKKFSPSIINNNLVRIHDGMCINQGTQMGIEQNEYADVIIENGVSGSKRNDLIVMRYERNADTSIEKASLVVIKGTAGATATTCSDSRASSTTSFTERRATNGSRPPTTGGGYTTTTVPTSRRRTDTT